ncbi:putative transcriptional regulatory protein C3C7,04 [Talaromyces islandicus]|uniref:Putative transcriptional regulatory protein C3C7,04 n=1 Tax=Talaromyces islandicus TaxID=28573 RepID=A0A0U1M5C6_TALIS|nr:putative transcriptional regulatory protein C3C7,04 [Talaromyces islandicus]
MEHHQYSPNRAKRPRVAEENRKRAVRACDGCRRVKEKCEGGVPCRRCTRYHRQCVFNTPAEPSDRVNRLHDRAASFSRDDDLEAQRVRYMERILAHYMPNTSFDVPSLRKIAEDLQKRHHDLSESDGPPTQVEGDDLDDLAIDEEDFSIRAFPDNTTHYSGEFSYLNFSNKIRRKIDEWMQNTAPEDNAESVPFEERWRATQLQSGSSLVSTAITCLPPRYVADFLINVASKYARTNNFYVEEDWLRDKLAICYNDPGSLTSVDAASVCAILMTLAIGTQFAHMESRTPVNKITREESTTDDHRFSEDEVGLTFYQFASKLLPDIIATASVRSVQACLLIGTYLLPLDTSGLSYTYYGLAMKLAIQNGMHRKYAGEGLDSYMQEIRNRVFWTAFTIERRISILHGRPPSITDSEVDADLPVDLPALVSTNVPDNYANMMALIKLTMKLGEFAQDISSLRKCPKWKQPEYLEKLLVQRRQLVEWWSTLPKENSCRDLNPAGPLFRSNVHLKLDYCLARIFIGRPFLFSNVKGVNSTTQHKSSAGRSKMRAVLVSDCVEGALEIVELCRLLRDETGLARASYTEFSSCRAALLVILAQSLTKRTERLRNALSQGMGLIKIMSMGVGSAKSAVSVIEALERAIRRLEDWSLSQAQSRQEALDSGYELFKNWEMLWKTGPLSPATGNATPSHNNNIAAQLHPMPTSSFLSTPAPFSSDQTMKANIEPSNNQTFNPTIKLDTMNNNTNATGSPAPHQLDIVHSPNTGALPQTPHFGFEGFISNFPQELDEFTAIPCFDTDALGHTTGPGVDLDSALNAVNQPQGEWSL